MFNLHNLSSRKLHLLSQRNDFSFTSFLDEKYSFRVFFGPSFFWRCLPTSSSKASQKQFEEVVLCFEFAQNTGSLLASITAQ